METRSDTSYMLNGKDHLAASAGNLAVGADSTETTNNLFEDLFDQTEFKLLELLRDGTRVINLHKAAKISFEDGLSYRTLLLRKFDIGTNSKNFDQLTYLAVVNGIVPVNVETAPLPAGVTEDEANTFRLMAEGLTTPQIAKGLGRSRGAIKGNRVMAIKKLNPNREPHGTAILAVKYGLVDIRPAEEQAAFAGEVRQRSIEQVAIFERVRPINIDELTVKWRHKTIDGRRFRIRVMKTAAQYREDKKTERAKQAAEEERAEQAVAGVDVDRLLDLAGTETFYDQGEVLPDDF